MDLDLFELCDDHGVKKWVKKHIVGSGAGIQSAIVGYNFNIRIWFHVISLNTILYFLLGVERSIDWCQLVLYLNGGCLVLCLFVATY
jgi:hypothetical protein